MAFSEFLWLIIRILYDSETTSTTADPNGNGTRLYWLTGNILDLLLLQVFKNLFKMELWGLYAYLV